MLSLPEIGNIFCVIAVRQADGFINRIAVQGPRQYDGRMSALAAAAREGLLHGGEVDLEADDAGLELFELLAGVVGQIAGRSGGKRSDRPALGLGDVFGGSVAGLLTITYGLSYAALIFSGPLAPWLGYGLTATDVLSLAETGLGGRTATTSIQGRERWPVQVRLAKSDREDIDQLGATPVPLPSGAFLPLRQLATIRRVLGPNEIASENGRLRAYVHRGHGGRVRELK